MKSKKYVVVSIVLIYLITLFLPFGAAVEAAESEVLTIQGALDMAYKNNPDLVKAGYEVEKAAEIRDDAAEVIFYMPVEGIVLPAVQQVINMYEQAEIGLHTAKKAQKAEKERISKEVIASYTTALKDYNNLENLNLSIRDLREQERINSLAWQVGITSVYEYEKFTSAIEKTEQTYIGAEKAYLGSVADLGALLGKSENWQPRLTSKSVLNTYDRSELSTELSRGLSESILVWTKKTLLDIEESKQKWIMPNLSSTMQRLDLDIAAVDYEQAKRNARSAIEQLYYGIDALEGMISAAEVANNQAQRDLKVAQTKYDLGIIPKRSMIPGSESLAAAELAAEQVQIELDNLRLDLANMKAQFNYLTGQTVFDEQDWSKPTLVSVDE